MTVRLISAIHLMLDAFIVSLVLAFVSSEAALPVAWSWLLAILMAACISCFLFSKRTYQLAWVLGIATVATSSMWGTGLPLWLAVLLGMLTVYLIHARYSAVNEDFNHDHHFLVKFVLVFSICWVLLLLNPDQQTSRLLFTLVPTAVLFYVASQLFFRYRQSAADGARFSQAAKGFSVIMGASAVTALLTFFFADDVRWFAGSLVGGAIRILFWPLALLLEQTSELLSGLSTEEEMQENIDKLETNEKAASNDSAMTEAAPADFPVEILLGIVILVCAVLLVLLIKKIKPDSTMPKQEGKAVIKRHGHTSAEQAFQPPVLVYGQSPELNQIREAFRRLEHTAKKQGVGRKNYETVREWLLRMQWDVTESFCITYDHVRYGDKQLPDAQALQFMNEIEKIKANYLKENV